MSTVAEIEAAIKALPPAERERLAEDLPSILPEHRTAIHRRAEDAPALPRGDLVFRWALITP